MDRIPFSEFWDGKGIALLEIVDRDCRIVELLIGKLTDIALNGAGENFEFAKDAEGTIVFPGSEFDAFFAAGLVEGIDLLAEMLDVGIVVGHELWSSRPMGYIIARSPPISPKNDRSPHHSNPKNRLGVLEGRRLASPQFICGWVVMPTDRPNIYALIMTA